MLNFKNIIANRGLKTKFFDFSPLSPHSITKEREIYQKELNSRY